MLTLVSLHYTKLHSALDSEYKERHMYCGRHINPPPVKHALATPEQP